MCTVVIRVPEPGAGDIRILAVRDEDPHHPWRPLGAWWPQHPGVSGIQDILAGGAWLARTDDRVAVLLNRAGGADVAVPTSRGGLVLGSVTGAPLPTPSPRWGSTSSRPGEAAPASRPGRAAGRASRTWSRGRT